MPIDFSSLAKPFQAIVPVTSGAFRLHKKRYETSVSDGFYDVKIQGNKVLKAVPALPSADVFPKAQITTGYTYGSEIIFSSMDTAKRKWGFSVKRELRFLAVETFTPVVALVWEDKNVYYVEPWYADLLGIEVKRHFDEEIGLATLKGVSPELRSLYLFHDLERQQARAIIKAAVEKEERERLMRDVGYRLKMTLEAAHAELRSFNRAGNRLTFTWTPVGSAYVYNTVIDAESFRVLEAGYCMSGDDARHSVTSLVKTAEDYEERDVVHITRR